jgi:hypothetical protein
MNKKPTHISEESSFAYPVVRRRNIHSLITPPNFDKNHEIASDTQFVFAEAKKLSSSPKMNFNICDLRPKKHSSLKKLSECSSNPEKREQNFRVQELNSLEKCRKVFDKIIESDKQYGEILRKIKEVYEKEIEKKDGNGRKESCFKRNLMKKIEDEGKMQDGGEKIKKVRSQSFLMGNPSLKVPMRNLKKKETGSTIDTAHISPTEKVPELTLGNIPRSEFHEEFMANYDAFSESWRKMVKHIRK